MAATRSVHDFKEGEILLLDKPLEWTSFQVVNKVRWLIRKHFGLKKIKVGHAGTLDPLATGLLVLCTGKATKRIAELQGQEKEYTGRLVLGATTPSYDLETEIDQQYPIEHISAAKMEKVSRQFTGAIKQVPPVYSALKQQGKRLYEFARSGEQIEIPPREVTIETFEITQVEGSQVAFRVVCSKGTYIRSLVHDFGQALGSGAYLSELRRTRIGNFSVDDALSIESFSNAYLSGSQ